jgi:TatD DNase family protein
MIIDVHCHLDICEKPEEIVKEADKQEITIVTNGINSETNRQTLEFVKKYKNVKACIGLYPIEALKLTDSEIENILANIRKNATNIWGIGEIGLDYKESTSEEEHARQIEVFRKFVQLSIELNKSVTIHSRKAEEECINILQEMGAKKVIMHCFCGKMNLVKRIIENGWFMSIPTSVNNSEHFQKVIELVPIEQLLCETDSPYLHPEKKWPNSSLNVIVSYKKIAQIKKLDIKEVQRQIEENFIRLS